MDPLTGPVPADWRLATLGELCDVLAGPSTARLPATDADPAVPVVTPRDLRNNRITGDGGAAVAPAVAAALVRYRLEAGDIVATRVGELGRQGLVGVGQHGWLLGTACLRIRSRGEINTAYLVYYLGHPAVRDWVKRNATGSAVPSLNTATASSLPVAVPPAASQALIGEILTALDEKVEAHERVSRATAAVRDAVLHRLLAADTPPG